MTFQIADAKFKFFKDKEHYLAFRRAWSESVNDKDTHLGGRHMLLYAILRGKDARTAFVPISSFNKLNNGAIINQGLYNAYTELQSYLSWRTSSIETFLAPFKGTVDEETFKQVMKELPDMSPLYSNYGSGTAIVKQIHRYRCGDQIDGFDYHKHSLWDLIDIVQEQVKRESEKKKKELKVELAAEKTMGEVATVIKRKRILGLF